MKTEKTRINNRNQQPQRFSDYRNYHQNQNIIVCGCGSSLNELTDPQDFITIGVNDVGRQFTPDYLVVLNSRNQFKSDRFRYVEKSQASALFTHLNLGITHPNIVHFKLGKRGGTEFTDFGSLPYTRNSPYVAACLAAFMGAKKIGLIGVDFTDDHFFAATGKHALTSQLAKINQEYSLLAQALGQQGIELVNLSASSKIMALPKQSISDFSKPPVTTLFGSKQITATVAANDKSEKALNIVHLAKTNCAGAIWNLHAALNTYANMNSRVVTASDSTNGLRYPRDLLLSQTDMVWKVLREADVVHFHNNLDKQSPELRDYSDILKNKPAVLQFHSEPAAIKAHFPGRDPAKRTDIKTLVIAQKHTRFYPRAAPVPNLLDINHPLLKPFQRKKKRPPVVMYNPTDKRNYPLGAQTCRGKGYYQTMTILQRLVQENVIKLLCGDKIPWKELMRKRARADILIDECVTGGYHLTSLEGLSQGLATIAYLDDTTIRQICDITGSGQDELPWVNCRIEQLEQQLRNLATDKDLLSDYQNKSRQWMEKYWCPEKQLRHYITAYTDVINSGKVLEFKEMQITKRDQLRRHYKINGTRSGRSEDYPQQVHLHSNLVSKKEITDQSICHILGNGPSINDIDLSVLYEEMVIGVNASPLLHDKLGRATDYYCVSDRRFFSRDNASEIFARTKGSVRVFAGYCHGFLRDKDINYVKICGGDGISEDIYKGFYHACTAALFAAQLALWLGYKHIRLYGCEFNYDKGRFFYEEKIVPADSRMYSRVEKNFRALSRVIAERGGTLSIVGPSRLVGDYGNVPVPGINKLSPQELITQAVQSISKEA